MHKEKRKIAAVKFTHSQGKGRGGKGRGGKGVEGWGWEGKGTGEEGREVGYLGSLPL